MSIVPHRPVIRLITADILIPGRGEPLTDGAVAYDGPRIVYVGHKTTIPKTYKSTDVIHVPVLMPGLWDCHVHFFGSPQFAFSAIYNTSKVLAGARCAFDVSQVLNAGFTSVRELGGYGVHLDQAIDEGVLIGPKIYPACGIISQTGGHGDAHAIPVHHFCDAINNGLPFHVCDGVDACIQAVRTQLRHGAKVIKVCASGGVVSKRDEPHHQQFSDAELSAIVEEANRAERAVAAHCHGKAGIMAALRAGCTTIEHATYLDDEVLEAMLEHKITLVPTRAAVAAGLEMRGAFDPGSYAKLVDMVPVHKEAYRRAVAAGVKIALGTDFGVSSPGTVFSHGRNGIELKHAVEAGLTPLQAIEAATANAPGTLGLQAPLSGQLKEGYDADFIALAANPLNDINIFTNPTNITHVWRGGKLFKSPERPIFTGLD
ncbi:hypothetical protein B7463_g3583, partial [Scytalidium lignicola]